MTARQPLRSRIPSWVIGLGACSAVVILMASLSREVHHWFIFPVFACGILIAPTAVEWLRERTDRFDPAAVLALVGVHFFFLAPLLHVYTGEWMKYITPPPDWRPWLGWMACLNAAGIAAYLVSLRLASSTNRVVRQRAGWRLHTSLFVPLLLMSMAASTILQLLVYEKFGGIQGYIDKYSSLVSENFAGWGWVFMFSEAFPILAAFTYVIYAQTTGRGKGITAVLLALVAVFALKIFFGGLRGSRINYVCSLFWTVGLIHLCIRPLRARFMLAGLAFMVAFMYAYGFYKNYGLDASMALTDSAAREKMGEAANRKLQSLILHDLGRSDVQAFLLYRVWADDSGSDYQLSWGRTYIGALAQVVPARLWPDRPPTGALEGTEAIWGRAASSRRQFATNNYGLAGEAILNFGPLGVPVAYAVFGIMVGRLRRWTKGLPPGDSRLLMVPFFVSVLLFLLIADSYVVFYYVITTGLFPVLLIAISSSRSRTMACIPEGVALPASTPSGPTASVVG